MDDEHGIFYTPSTVRSTMYKSLTIEDVKAAPSIGYVYVYWVDLTNTRRCRILPKDYFITLVEKSKRPGINIAHAGLGLVYLNLAEGFSGTGEMLYKFDLSNMRILHGVGADEKVLAVLGCFEHKSGIGQDNLGLSICPRSALITAVNACKTACSTEFLVGFESEFILLKSTNPIVASNIHSFSAAAGMLSGSVESKILHEIAECLKLSRIPLQMYLAEAAPGQYEIVSGPLPPTEACDALNMTREVIVNVAAKHGLRATFAPRPFTYSIGSSCHAHISVHSSNGALEPSNKMTPLEESFLAGLLDHLPAVTAFTLPTSASYKRAVDSVWSGGTYVAYGTENREAPIRLTNESSPSSRHFELRFIDATANPYLAMAAIIRAGMAGLAEQKSLTMKNCVDIAAALMTPEQRQEMGITKRMPLSIEEARRYLVEDTVMREALGQGLVKDYLAVNVCLDSSLNPDGEDEQQLLTRLVEFY